MSTHYAESMANDDDVMNRARRITTGVDDFDPAEEVSDPLDPNNLSFTEIVDYSSDPEWMDKYGDRIPDEYWAVLEEVLSDEKGPGYAGTD